MSLTGWCISEGFNLEGEVIVNITIKKYDDWGKVVGETAIEMSEQEIAEVINRASDLIAINRASRRSSGDMEAPINDLEKALVSSGVF